MGYGFVTYETADAADSAVNSLQNLTLDGREINIERATPKGEARRGAPRRGGRGAFYGGGSYRGMRERGAPRGRSVRRGTDDPEVEPSKTTIFVGNLPFNVIDQDLYNIFKEYAVSSAHVVRRFDGASRGFGFVTMENEAEQAKALEALAEIWCDDRKLVLRAARSDDAPPRKNVIITNAATGEAKTTA